MLALSFLTFEIPASYAAPLYAFTNASSTGINGPTQAQVNSAYTATPLAGLVTINTRGIQEWTVPTTGEYWLEFAGASGGYTPGALGGKGRIIKVKVNLTAGNILKILVGQEGGRAAFTTGFAGGGGGGTYIYNATTSLYIGVAGGGGGAAQGDTNYVSTQVGLDAAAYNSTSGVQGSSYSGSYGPGGAGGTNGGAGLTNGGGAPGAGINENGGAGTYGGSGGTRFSSGGAGGANGVYSSATTTMTTDVPGGFGGGAGASLHSSYEAIGGGGGGYSGGGPGGTRIGAGGGGGSFFTGTYVSNGLNTGHGFVKIQLAVPPTVELSLSSGTTTASKGINTTISAVIDDVGFVTFFADNRAIPRCRKISAPAGTVNCIWRPSTQKSVTLRAELTQNGSVVASKSFIVKVQRRTTFR
jgi:hypothetical protein